MPQLPIGPGGLVGHSPNALVELFVFTCDIKLLRCLDWCGLVLFCSDNDRIFLTACGDAAPNFGGPPIALAIIPPAIWTFLPSLVELVELVVDKVGDGCRFRIVTVFGADPPLCSHSNDN